MLTRRNMLSSTALALVSAGVPARAQSAPDTEWRYYAADLASTRYSPLDQINEGNFDRLQVAWRLPTTMLGSRPEYTWEATPLLIKGRLYSTAGARRDVVCVDGARYRSAKAARRREERPLPNRMGCIRIAD